MFVDVFKCIELVGTEDDDDDESFSINKLFPPRKHNNKQFDPKAHPWIGTRYSDSLQTQWFRHSSAKVQPKPNITPQQTNMAAADGYNANYPYAPRQRPYMPQQQQRQQYAGQRGQWAQTYPQYQQPGFYQQQHFSQQQQPQAPQVPQAPWYPTSTLQAPQYRTPFQSDQPPYLIPQSPYPVRETCPQTCSKHCAVECPSECCSRTYFDRVSEQETGPSAFTSSCPSECKTKCNTHCPQKCCGLNLCPFVCRRSCLSSCPKRCCLVLKEYLPPLALPPLKLSAAVCPTHCQRACSTDCPQKCCSRSEMPDKTTKCPSACLNVRMRITLTLRNGRQGVRHHLHDMIVVHDCSL